MNTIAIINTVNKQSPNIDAILITNDRNITLRTFINDWILTRTPDATIVDGVIGCVASYTIGTYVIETHELLTTVYMITEKKSTAWTGPDMLRYVETVGVFTVSVITGPVLPDVKEELEAASMYITELEEQLEEYPSTIISLRHTVEENTMLRKNITETERQFVKERMQVQILMDILENSVRCGSSHMPSSGNASSIVNMSRKHAGTGRRIVLDSITDQVKEFDMSTLRNRSDSKRFNNKRVNRAIDLKL